MNISKETDVNVIAKIILQFREDMLKAGMPEEAFDGLAEKYAKYASFLVLRDEGKVIGFIAFYCNDYIGKVSFISMVVTAEKYRKAGNGTKMLKLACETAVKHGMDKITANVRRDNYKSIGMFQKNGMLKLGITEYDEFIFEKNLRTEKQL